MMTRRWIVLVACVSLFGATVSRGDDEPAAIGKQLEAIRLHLEQQSAQQRLIEDARREVVRAQEIAAELRVKLAAAEAELETLRKANATLEKLAQSVERIGPAADVRQATEPPAVEIRGKITNVADAGLFVVSIGSDDGARQGFVLEVTRGGDQGLSLGTITLVRAYGRQSIGQFKPTGKERPEVGDEVTTRIIRK
jgi:hypothetical protein